MELSYSLGASLRTYVTDTSIIALSNLNKENVGMFPKNTFILSKVDDTDLSYNSNLALSFVDNYGYLHNVVTPSENII